LLLFYKFWGTQVEITERIRGFVVENFLLGAGENLKNDDSFLAQGIIDSTGVLELVGLVEETYEIEVGDDELTPENFDSIDRIAGYVARKLKSGAAPATAVFAKVN
jgi:acyl carrier protein